MQLPQSAILSFAFACGYALLSARHVPENVRQTFFMYCFCSGRLFAAARFNQVQAAELLIENGISVNAVEKHRDTALMITANVTKIHDND